VTITTPSTPASPPAPTPTRSSGADLDPVGAPEAAPGWVRLMGPLLPVIPVAGLLISGFSQLSGSGKSWQEVFWANSVGWLVGAFMFMGSTPHLLMPGPVARSIGWAPSPFQWELGAATLGMAIAGVLASGQPRAFSLAVIIVFSTFMLGAAIGHVREMVTHHNFASGNAGPIFFYDVLAPLVLIYLYVATS
jgi:hypothetical protein